MLRARRRSRTHLASLRTTRKQDLGVVARIVKLFAVHVNQKSDVLRHLQRRQLRANAVVARQPARLAAIRCGHGGFLPLDALRAQDLVAFSRVDSYEQKLQRHRGV